MKNALLEILFSESYMNLATCANNDPWCAPLVFALDVEMNLYWVSSMKALHSRHVADNSVVACSIYPSQQPQNSAQGLYFKGNAGLVPDTELERSIKLFYGWRYPDPEVLKSKVRSVSDFSEVSPRRMYRMSISSMFGLDPSGDPEHGRLLDYRVETDLSNEFAEKYRLKYAHLLD